MNTVSRLLLSFFALALISGLAACGGGEHAGSSSGASASDTGDIQIVIPEAAALRDAIPGGTASYRVHVLDPVSGEEVVSPVTASRQSGSTTIIVRGVPRGSWRIVVECLDATGSIVALATPSVTVSTGVGTVVSIPSVNTLKSLIVTPSAGSVDVGGTLELTATATFSDSSSAVVNGVTSWTSADTGIATVSNAGTDHGTVTGVSAGGPVVIQATYSTMTSSASVTVVGGSSLPTVTGVSPSTGGTTGGTAVTITGTNLGGATSVMFGSTAATITSNSATQIIATAPAGTGTVDVTVTTAEGTSPLSSAARFTYVAQIFVMDKSNNRVVRMDDMNGTNFTSFGSSGGGSGQFNSPSGLFVLGNGQIFVGDSLNNRVVRMDDMNGTNFTTFGSSGTGSGQFQAPNRVFVSSLGEIYVLDSANHRVVRMDDMNGTNLTTCGSSGSGTGTAQFKAPLGLFVSSGGQIFVADQGNHRVCRMNDMSGAGFTTYGGAAGGGFLSLQDIFVNGAGQIFVADTFNHRVVRMDDMSGTGFTSFGDSGTLDRPRSVFVTESNQIFLTSGDQNRVVRIDDMSGSGFTTFGSSGTGTGSFQFPMKVFIR